jgi:hypothetical protein
VARDWPICYVGAMNLKRLFAPLLLSFTLLALTGCESMNSVRQSLEDLNKVLAPLAVIKKGGGS